MSATGRGAVRSPNDFYATPRWVTEALLRAVQLPGGLWMEPSVGDGAIVRAVNRDDVRWLTFDIRPDCGHPGVIAYDFLKLPVPDTKYDVLVGNPPFSLAMEFVQHAITQAKIVALLLRLNFLASLRRQEFMQKNTPSVYVLSRRPAFLGNGKTDATEYAWFLWQSDNPQDHGRVQVL